MKLWGLILMAALLAACSAATPELLPTQAIVPATNQPPITATFEEIVLPTSTRAPSKTPTAIPATATDRPTRTPRPTATVVPPTDTARAPANTALPANTQPPVATALPTAIPPTLAPTQPPAATIAPATITLISLTSPIGAGSDASLVVQVSAGAGCFLSYTTPSGTDSTAQGLGATTANAEGRCGWSWKIGSNTNPGTGRLFVSSGGANATFDIVIQ